MVSIIGSILILVVLFSPLKTNEQLKEWDPTEHKNWGLINLDDCGISSDDRIIGGLKATLGQFPWIVRLGIQMENIPKIFFKCGAVLLNRQYVLTAAHCLSEPLSTIQYKFRIGEFDSTTDIDCENNSCSYTVQDLDAEKIILHNKYNPRRYQHDIALIRLKSLVKLNDYVSTICLPYGEMMKKSYVGEIAEVAGWGIQNITTEDTSTVLLYVSVPVVTKEKCRKAFSSYARITDEQLCAGAPGLDSCGGDSGGPLMKVDDFNGTPRYYLLGVVSFGSNFCGSKVPGVYTDVTSYMKWILDNIEP